MMDSEKKDVVVRSKREKGSAKQRACGEVEGALGFSVGKQSSLLEALLRRYIA
jgi:hypothetical protein